MEDVAEQIRNTSDEGTVGRLLEPVSAAFAPEHTIAETIDALRDKVKTTLITYIYITDSGARLLGVVTMRDLLFSERHKTLAPRWGGMRNRKYSANDNEEHPKGSR